jgi:hypothetical protein
MQNILGDLKYVKIYVDDIRVTFTYSFIKQRTTSRTHSDSLQLLGFIIDHEGLKMDPEKVEAIVNRKEPTNLKELQSWLGLTNFYRKFVESYAKIMAPLH